MSLAIHHSAPHESVYVVPDPRVTDAIGEALRGSYRGAEQLPADMAAALTALDRIGRA